MFYILLLLLCFCGKLIKGKFPDENTNEDGFDWVAPVDAFPAQNKYGKEYIKPGRLQMN